MSNSSRKLAWYQEMMLRNVCDKYGSDGIFDALRKEEHVFKDSDILGVVLQGGTTMYNFIARSCQSRSLRLALQNHGIPEKWKWTVYADFQKKQILNTSTRWFDSKEEATMDAARQRVNISPSSLELESYCHCNYENPARTTEICACIQKWKRQHKVFIKEGKVEHVPELLNYTGAQ